ncbi:MAG: hypothetical protein RJB38_910, partial [Pseudomonadota bacterium]
GLLVQKNVFGALLSIQVMSVAGLLILVYSAGEGILSGNSQASGRAHDASLVLMVVFQVQALAALAYLARLHYQRETLTMKDLTSNRR